MSVVGIFIKKQYLAGRYTIANVAKFVGTTNVGLQITEVEFEEITGSVYADYLASVAG